MFCANCGNKVSETDMFCANCGFKQNFDNSKSHNKINNFGYERTQTKTDSKSNVKPNVNVDSQHNPTVLNPACVAKKGFPKSLIFVLVIVIIAVAGLAFFMINNSSKPEDTAKTFFENVKSGNVEKAIDCMSPEIKNQWNLGMGLANSLGSYLGISGSSSLLNSVIGLSDSNAYQNYEFKVQNAKYSGESNATVPVDVYVNGSKQQTTILEMKKIDNKWYICK